MLHFVGFGWKKRLRKVKGEYTLSIVKELIIGNALRKGEAIFYFLVRYNNRNAILVFLDGREFKVNDTKQTDLKKFIMKE